MSFGAALKQAREAQGVTLHDVAQKTKIRLDYLRALEEGNIAALPERTFARSYLQRYARELHLDPSPLLADFDRTMPLNTDLSPGGRAATTSERITRPALVAAASRRGLNPVWLLAGLLLLGGGAYYAVGMMNGRDSAQSATTPATEPASQQPATPEPAEVAAPRSVNLTVSSVPAGARVFVDNRELGVTPLQSFPVDARDRAELRVELAGRTPLRTGIALNTGRNLRASLTASGKGPSSITDLAKVPKPAPTAVVSGQTPGAPADSTGAVPPGAPATAPATTPTRSPVSVTFTGEAWTRITDATGRVLYQGTPPAGSVKGFPAGVVIRTGNAAAVKVSVNGAPAQSMGESGQVVAKKY